MTRIAAVVLASALATLVLLGAAQARGPHPSVDVDKTIDAADETAASGTITVCNVSDEPIEATVASVDDVLSYKQRGGPWTELVAATVIGLAAGDIIAPESCADASWSAVYVLPEGTTALRNEVRINLVDRDKMFIARASFEFADPDD